MDLRISIGVFIGSILLITVFRSQFKGDIGELVLARSMKGLDKEKYYKDTRDIKKKENQWKHMPQVWIKASRKRRKVGKFIGCSNYPKCRFVVNSKIINIPVYFTWK